MEFRGETVMKKLFIILLTIFTLCSCSLNPPDFVYNDDYSSINTSIPKEMIDVFTKTDNDNYISNEGVEYTYFSHEGKDDLYLLGELEHLGTIKDEERYLNHLDSSTPTGFYALKNDKEQNFLVRITPDSEWRSLYRKTSFQNFNTSLDNCVRLELVYNTNGQLYSITHKDCNKGITDKTEINNFLSTIRAQNNPKDAGLYDLVRKSDGSLENCYASAVYAYFNEEPNIVLLLDVTVYNDLAYSIRIDDKEYVLPNDLFNKLKSASDHHLN